MFFFLLYFKHFCANVRNKIQHVFLVVLLGLGYLAYHTYYRLIYYITN